MGSGFWDFCPLCGYRFRGKTPEAVYEKIGSHVEDKTCEKNFRPLTIALADTGGGVGRGYYEPKGGEVNEEIEDGSQAQGRSVQN